MICDNKRINIYIYILRTHTKCWRRKIQHPKLQRNRSSIWFLCMFQYCVSPKGNLGRKFASVMLGHVLTCCCRKRLEWAWNYGKKITRKKHVKQTIEHAEFVVAEKNVFIPYYWKRCLPSRCSQFWGPQVISLCFVSCAGFQTCFH